MIQTIIYWNIVLMKKVEFLKMASDGHHLVSLYQSEQQSRCKAF